MGLDCFGWNGRKENLEGGSFMFFAIDVDKASMAPDYGGCGGQSQARAFADIFGAEKRLKNSVFYIGR